MPPTIIAAQTITQTYKFEKKIQPIEQGDDITEFIYVKGPQQILLRPLGSGFPAERGEWRALTGPFFKSKRFKKKGVKMLKKPGF